MTSETVPLTDGVIEDDKKLIAINISGTVFELPQSLIYKFPKIKKLNGLLTNGEYMYVDAQSRPYFPADPDVFRHLLLYLRYGELHLPLNMCGVVNHLELKYWGFNPALVERCCWNNISFHSNERSSLQNFESYLTEYNDDVFENEYSNKNKVLGAMWMFFTRPALSKFSIGYAVFTALVALLSMVVLSCETVLEYEEMIESQANKTVSAGTESQYLDKGMWIMEDINLFCCIYFTVDLILRFICSPKKCKFCVDVLNIMDIMSIASFYVEYLQEAVAAKHRYDPRHEIVNYTRLGRILSVFRIIRVFRFYFGFRVLIYTFRASFRDFLVMVLLIFSAVSVFGSLFYMCEGQERVSSIFEGLYWALITITTVGYGDFYPRTLTGKLVASLCAVTGILTIAFSVPLIVGKFLSFYQFAENPPVRVKKPNPTKVLYSVLTDKTHFCLNENNTNEST